LKQSIPYYDKEENAAGSLISRLTTDPKVIQESMGTHGAFPLIAIFTIIGSIIVAFVFGWKLTLVVLFSALPVLFISAFFRLRHEIKFDEMNAKVFAHSSQFASEAIGAFRTVSALTMEAKIVDRFEILLKEQIKNALLREWYAAFMFALSDSAMFAAMALTFW
jgi:ATP-binding cassette, subfamily B (MDR/TAP), member 1